MIAPRFSLATLGARITSVAIAPVFAVLGATVLTLTLQQQQLRDQVTGAIATQAHGEAGKVARSIYLLCDAAEKRNQEQLTRDLTLVHELVTAGGGFNLSSDTVSWDAVNQVTQAEASVKLPKLLLGTRWLGQVRAASEPALLVDEIRTRTGDYCTVFQRMNDAGDMLRVNTSVLRADGSRGTGTYIAAKAADGTDNPIVAAVLRGDTYRGRAFVVREWHTAAYEPIWDAEHRRVIGMLYVGVGMQAVNKELQSCIAQMVVGKTGGVIVIGAAGDERGHCLLSARAEQVGQDLRPLRDAAGAPFVESFLKDGTAATAGQVAFSSYRAAGAKGEPPTTTFAALTAFTPWNWIVVATTPESDFSAVRQNLEQALQRSVSAVVGVALAVALLAAAVGMWVSRRLSRSIRRVIRELRSSHGDIQAAAAQVSSESQTLAAGASQQAAAVQQTSASLVELGGASERNAETAKKAATLAHGALASADRGVTDIGRMNGAMDALKLSSADTAKIIKTIDEIAFQTNILALNAAVEAARAGEAGLGFAVVADEVRALAQRSATAARDTAEKIEATITRSREGLEISAAVSTQLGTIARAMRDLNGLINEVAEASGEQQRAVQQISSAVSDMDHVVQRNAAGAESQAAASDQLTRQVAVLRGSVHELARMVGDASAAATATDAPTTPRGTARPHSAHFAAGSMSGPTRPGRDQESTAAGTEPMVPGPAR